MQLLINPVDPWASFLVELPSTYAFPIFSNAIAGNHQKAAEKTSEITTWAGRRRRPRAAEDKETCVYRQIRKTICPSLGEYATDYLVDMLSPQATEVRLLATTEYILSSLGESSHVVSSITSPGYLELAVDDALLGKEGAPLEIRVTSDSDIPALVQVEYGGCTQMDLLQTYTSLSLDTFGQVMVTKGFITLDDRSVPRLQKGQWFLKLTVLPQATDACQDFSKEFTVEVRVGLSPAEYTFPIVISIAVILLVILAFLVYLEVARKMIQSRTRLRFAVAEGSDENEQSLQGGSSRVPPQAVKNLGMPPKSRNNSSNNLVGFSLTRTLSSEGLLTHDPSEARGHFQVRAGPLYVSDLNLKTYDQMRQQDVFYLSLISAVCLYYLLPLIGDTLFNQLSLNQNVSHLCYFNFSCSHRLGPIRAFNSVISNQGFILLGAAYLFIVFQRASRYAKEREASKKAITLGVPQECGLPRFYHLYYSLGLLIFMEGIFGGLFAICPTKDNAQFDATMVILSLGLMIIILYQKRHPDFLISPLKSSLFFGSLILLTLISTYFSGVVLWALAASYAAVFFFVGVISIYYYGQFRWDLESFAQLFENLTSRTKPREPSLFVFLLLGTLMNLGAFIFGFVTDPSFSDFVLCLMLLNFGLYLFFYLGMKQITDGKTDFLLWVYALLSIAFLVASLVVLSMPVTNHDLSPSESRMYNSECVLLHFYDTHDLWHLFSALGLFFAAIALLVVDDDLNDIPRQHILVF